MKHNLEKVKLRLILCGNNVQWSKTLTAGHWYLHYETSVYSDGDSFLRVIRNDGDIGGYEPIRFKL